MSNKKERVTFEEMNLRIGNRLQLVAFHPGKVSYYSTLTEYKHDKCLSVEMPQENGKDAPFKMSERIDVRFFSGISIYIFSSIVNSIYFRRQTFLELSFPGDIHVIKLRKDMRMSHKLPVMVANVMNGKLEQPRIVITADISASGAMLQTTASLGEVGEEIGFSFSVKNKTPEQDTCIKSRAVIRNCRVENAIVAGKKPVYKHGVLFTQLDPADQLLLQSYLYESALKDRHAE